MNQQLIQHFNQHGKTHTWYELAVMFNILPDGNRKQRADKVRKFYNRVYLKSTEITPTVVKKVDPLLEEFRSFLKSKNENVRYTPYKGNTNNILVIGDTHIPHQHPDYLNFLIELQKKWDCGKVIHIGDIVDFSSTTFHDVNPEMPSPAYEFEYAKAEIKKWEQAFPELVITIGNHDRRVSRKMNGNQIHGIWQRSFNDVFETKWQFVPEYVYNNIYFCHGEGATARMTALQKQMSTVQGHRHCLPDTYRVLVKHKGIINIKDVVIGDIVYGYKNGSFCETTVLNTISGIYTGEMYKFNNKYFKQQVTKEHKFYTKDDKYLSFSEFLKEKVNNVVISAKGFYNNIDYNISDDMLKLIVAICADGSFDTSNSLLNVRFHFRKTRKIERLTEIINRLGFNIQWSIQKDLSVKSQYIDKELREIISNILPKKVLPTWFLDLSERQIDIVIDEIKYWDGYENVSKNITTTYYCSYKKEERDLMCEILIKRGFLPSISKNKTVYWNNKKELSSKTGIDSKWYISNSVGLKPSEIFVNNFGIACLETDIKNFIVLTDDNSFELSGNSEQYIDFPAKNLFAVQCPLGVNRESLAFEYAKVDPKEWTLGACVILNGKTPIIERL